LQVHPPFLISITNKKSKKAGSLFISSIANAIQTPANNAGGDNQRWFKDGDGLIHNKANEGLCIDV
jgi:hypothetical protein